MNAVFEVMLDALRMAQPVVQTALERLIEDPARRGANLRHLEAACGTLKEDANTLVAMLIARPSNDDMLTEAEVLFRYFGQVEGHIAAIIEEDQPQ